MVYIDSSTRFKVGIAPVVYRGVERGLITELVMTDIVYLMGAGDATVSKVKTEPANEIGEQMRYSKRVHAVATATIVIGALSLMFSLVGVVLENKSVSIAGAVVLVIAFNCAILWFEWASVEKNHHVSG